MSRTFLTLALAVCLTAAASAQPDLAGCTPRLKTTEFNLASTPDAEAERRVEELFAQDQAARSAEDIDWSVLSKEDAQRREETLRYLSEGKLASAAALVKAAFIFQHGDCPAYYKLANDLASKAVELGEEKAGWIYAATLDRYLLSKGEEQKFGTQYSSTDGCTFALEPYDPSTTDAERAAYNVPSLEEAKARAETFGDCSE